MSILLLEITKEGSVYLMQGAVMFENEISERAETKEEAEKILRPLLVTYSKLGYQLIVEDVTQEFIPLMLEVQKDANIIDLDKQEGGNG